MGKVVRVGGRGTARRVETKEKDNWTGTAYKEYTDARKSAAKNMFVTVGRGTRKIKMSDIAETKGRSSGKGRRVSTNRGTGRRLVE